MRGERRPQRVLLTADAVGGVWAYSLELARGLSSHGVAVTLATMGPRPDGAQRAAARAIDGLDLHESDFALEWMPQPWDDVRRAGDWLQDLAARVAPSLIHLNGYAHAALGWPAPTVCVAHSCVFSWFQAVRGTAPDAGWDTYRRAVRRGLHAADAVAAPTAWMLRALGAHYGFLGGVVVPNGSRLPPPAPAHQREPFVLAAGRLWDDAKNVGALDAAAPTLSWPVLVAGETRHPGGPVRQLTAARALGRLTPGDLSGWLLRAGIYALPARYEPFGLSVLEAAGAGCPLVLGDIPSLRENWDGAAVFVPSDDPSAIRAALEALIAAPGRRTELGRRAAARAREFTPDRMTQGYLRLYESVTAARTDRRQSCAS